MYQLPRYDKIDETYERFTKSGMTRFVVVYKWRHETVYGEANNKEQLINSVAGILFDFWNDFVCFEPSKPDPIGVTRIQYEMMPEGAKKFVLDSIISKYKLDKNLRIGYGLECGYRDVFDYIEKHHKDNEKHYKLMSSLYNLAMTAKENKDNVLAYKYVSYAYHGESISISNVRV